MTINHKNFFKIPYLKINKYVFNNNGNSEKIKYIE